MQGRSSEQGSGLLSVADREVSGRRIQKDLEAESRRRRKQHREGSGSRIEEEPDGRKDGFRRVMAGMSGNVIKFVRLTADNYNPIP